MSSLPTGLGFLPLPKKIPRYAPEAELQNMTTWCDSHGLCLNNDKTKVLVFKKPRIDFSSLASITPSPCSYLKILGVVFNDKLNWDSHVDAVST